MRKSNFCQFRLWQDNGAFELSTAKCQNYQKYFKFNTYTQETSLTQGHWWSVKIGDNWEQVEVWYIIQLNSLATTKYPCLIKHQ